MQMDDNFQIRLEDMSARGQLRLFREEDGDIIVSIVPEGDDGRLKRSVSVQFCLPGSGGGGSPRTFKALQALLVAMQEDNEDPKCHMRHFQFGTIRKTL
jgi:hypothetical protein